jgi:hypothetical protein
MPIESAPDSFEGNVDDTADSMISNLLMRQAMRTQDIQVASGAIIPELLPGLWDMIKEDVGRYDRNLWPDLLMRVAGFCCFKVVKNGTGDWLHANPVKPEMDRERTEIIAEKLLMDMNIAAKVEEIRDRAKREEGAFLESMRPALNELNRRFVQIMTKP